jgi:Holliday junction resolvasome RuvABC endonuclease subunit
MRVAGLDLSITATGVALPDDTLKTVTGKAKDGDGRLAHLFGVALDLANLRLDLVVIEDLPTHAHGAGITGMVHGAVRCALISRGVPYLLVPPATLKKYATGKGNAPKPDMRMALYKRTGIDVSDDNQVDAWWLRAIGMQVLGEPIIDLPAAQIAALSKLYGTWLDAA